MVSAAALLLAPAFLLWCADLSTSNSPVCDSTLDGRNVFGMREASKHHNLGRQRCVLSEELRFSVVDPCRDRQLASECSLRLRGGSDKQENEPQPMEVDTNTTGIPESGEEEAAGENKVSVTVKWKFSSMPLEISADEPADLLKLQLFSLTRVPPEAQFLLGVYKPGEDVDLKSKGIKTGQTLVLIGEPSPAVEEETQTSKEQDNSSSIKDERQRGFFSLASTSHETARERGERIDTTEILGTLLGGTLPAQPGDGAKERSALLDTRDKLTQHAFRYDPVPENAPLTLPEEFWAKKPTEYTEEEQGRLKVWLNETREWRIRTKMMQEEEEKEAEAAEERRQLADRQKQVDEAVAEHEKEMNEWGLSHHKAGEIIVRGMELLQTTDIATNETTFEQHKEEFTGGYDLDQSPRFHETFDVIEQFILDGLDRTNREALVNYEKWKVYDREMQAEIEAEEEEVEYDTHEASDVESDGDSESEPDEIAVPQDAMVDADSGVPRNQPGELSEEDERRKELRKALAGMVAYGWKREQRMPAGLHNLGNTCYMAAAMQLLRCVPELMKELLTWKHSAPSMDPTENLVAASKLLFEELGASRTSVHPYTMIYHLRQCLPQFAQMGSNRVPMQQDSEECLSSILQGMGTQLLTESKESIVSNLFEIELELTSNCTEAEEEVQVEQERMFRLPLHIDAKTNVIHDALKNAFNSQVMKSSPSLGRDAVYNVTGKISKLPPYLLAQFVRFYWRQDTKAKAKVCRNVFFPTTLDLIEYVADDLKGPIELKQSERRLKYMEANPVWDDPNETDELTKKWRAMEREDAEEARRQEEARLQAALGTAALPDDDMEDVAEQQKMQDDERRAEEEAKKRSGAGGREKKPSVANAASDIEHSAIYELRGVLCHQGRFADAGHYISFVKTKLREQKKQRNAPQVLWAKFDDDEVTMVTEEEVKKTAGGADGPIAYICLYARSEGVAEGISEAHQRRTEQY